MSTCHRLQGCILLIAGNDTLGRVLPKGNCFVPKTGLHSAKGATCKYSFFLQSTALHASLAGTFHVLTSIALPSISSMYEDSDTHSPWLQIHCYIVVLINKKNLLSFSIKTWHILWSNQWKLLLREESGKHICCSKSQLIAIGRESLSLVMVC